MTEEGSDNDRSQSPFRGIHAVGLGVKSFFAGAIGEHRIVVDSDQQQSKDEKGQAPDVRNAASVATEATMNANETQSSASSPSGEAESGRSNAFAKLVRGWEAYINDSDGGLHGDPFSSLQNIHNLELCAPQTDGLYNFNRLTGPLVPTPEDAPLPPQAFRHTHSTPLKYGPTVYEEEDAFMVPGPIPLDPYQRSSSTPSSFRHRSVTSAFSTLTPRSTLNHRASYSSLKAFGSTSRAQSAFDPVRYYARALDEMEHTSIEVINTIPEPEVQADEEKSNRGAASRATKFLADVGVLRRRRRNHLKGAKISTVASVQSEVMSVASVVMDRQDSNMTTMTEQRVEIDFPDANVTVFTEHEPSFPEFPVNSEGSDVAVIVNSLHKTTIDETCHSSEATTYVTQREGEDEGSPLVQHYQKLYGEEEELKIRRIEPTLHHGSDSSGTTPPPPYQMLEDHSNVSSRSHPRVRLMFSREQIQGSGVQVNGCSSTPSPTAMTRGGSNTTGSTDSGTTSPGTYGTGSTTQETYTSSKSNPQSGLTTISDTDREVMLANRASYQRRERLQPSRKPLNAMSTRNRYEARQNSPASLREGAIVPAEEMFARQGSTMTGRRSVSFQLPQGIRMSGQSISPGTLETSSATNTTSSTAATEENPPTFVSYLERQGASDLTFIREAHDCQEIGCATDKAGNQSVPELTRYPDAIFGHASSVDLPTAQPSPSRPSQSSGLLSRPPKSPFKPENRIVATPSPRGSLSPLLHQQSPPRIIVDHPMSISPVNRPHIMRSTTMTPLAVSPLSFQEGLMLGQRYADGSIEILKSDSKDDRLTPSSPIGEKENH